MNPSEHKRYIEIRTAELRRKELISNIVFTILFLVLFVYPVTMVFIKLVKG